MTWFRSALFNTNTLRLNTENGGLSNGLNSRAPHAGIASALLLADDGPERVRSDRAARHDGIDDAAPSPAIGPWDGLHSVPPHPGPTAIELRVSMKIISFLN